jgi:quinol monooxygenase YgiN
MVEEVVTITPSPEERDDVVHTLRLLQGPTGADPGCLLCRITAEVGDERCLRFISQWRSWEDLERHVRSHEYRSLLALMEVSTVPPEVAFHTVTETKGIELVKTLRSGAGSTSATDDGSVV